MINLKLLFPYIVELDINMWYNNNINGSKGLL